jgi:hypothetical protein
MMRQYHKVGYSLYLSHFACVGAEALLLLIKLYSPQQAIDMARTTKA